MPKTSTAATRDGPATKRSVAEEKRARSVDPIPHSASHSVIAAEPAKKLKKNKKLEIVAIEPAAPSPDIQLVKKAANKKGVTPLPASERAPLMKRKGMSSLSSSEESFLKKKKKAAASSSSAGASPPATAPSTATAALLAGRVGNEGSRLDRDQIMRAVRALLTHVERTKSGALLESDESPIHVLIGTKQMPKAVGKAKECKPVPLALPFPYVSLDSAEICLITKDPQREYKDKLAACGLRAKVIGVSKLKKKYHPHEAKRELCATYDIFLADACVLPMLPPLLGKTFFQKKRLPTGVNLKTKDLRAELQRAACGTVYRHATGTSNSLQVGTTEQPVEHLVENIVAAVEQAVKQINGKWDNIQSLQLRTTNSIALPFYNALPHA